MSCHVIGQSQPVCHPPKDPPEKSPHSGILKDDYKNFNDPKLLKIFLEYCRIMIPHVRAGRPDLLSQSSQCPNPANCDEAKKACDDQVVSKMVTNGANRNQVAWIMIANFKGISDKTKNKIEENSADDYIRCMDVMHRVYHHDNNTTWVSLEVQARINDRPLADLIQESFQP